MAKTLLEVAGIAAATTVPSTTGADVGGKPTAMQLPPGTGRLDLTVRADYGAGATAGLTVDVFTSTDGVNWDTLPFATHGPTLSAGAAVQETFQDDYTGIGWVAATARNTDASVATGAVSVALDGV